MIFSDINSLIMVLVYGIIASAISFLTVYFTMPKAIAFLVEKGMLYKIIINRKDQRFLDRQVQF